VQNVSQRTWTGSRCPKKGKLETFTTAYYAPFGFEADPPYAMGVVDFGGGLKLFARLAKNIKPEDLKWAGCHHQAPQVR